MGSPELAQRIADLFLEEWVGELAGSVTPRRKPPVAPPPPPPPKPPKPTVKPGRLTPEALAFIRESKLGVPQLMRELVRKWEIRLGPTSLYKIRSGWTPLRFSEGPAPARKRAVGKRNRVSPEILAFVRSQHGRVQDLQEEITRRWGITLSPAVIYKIWNGWSPARACVAH